MSKSQLYNNNTIGEFFNNSTYMGRWKPALFSNLVVKDMSKLDP